MAKVVHYEVLMNMDDEDLPTMADFYREDKALSFASSCLANGYRLKKAIRTFPIKFVSPVGSWAENGTFFMIVEVDDCYEISIVSGYLKSETAMHSISNGLNQTKRINFNSRKFIVFKDIHNSFHYLVMAFIHARKLEVEKDETFHILRMEKTDALKFELKVPSQLKLRSLEPSDAYEISAYWSRYYPQTVDYFRILIQANGGYGIVTRRDGELVSWAIKTMSGTIGYVQTVERALRRGYASILVKLMAKELVYENQYPIVLVQTTDTIANLFFESLGFQLVGLSHNIYLKRKKIIQPLYPQKKEKSMLPFRLRWYTVGNPYKRDLMEAGPSWASNPVPLRVSKPPKVEIKRKPLPRIEFTDLGKRPTPKRSPMLGLQVRRPNPLKRKIVSIKEATVSVLNSSLVKLRIKQKKPSPNSPISSHNSSVRFYSINPSPGSSRSGSRVRRSSSRESSSKGSYYDKLPTSRIEISPGGSSSHWHRRESRSSSNSEKESSQQIDIKGKSLTIKRPYKKRSKEIIPYERIEYESKSLAVKESTVKKNQNTEAASGSGVTGPNNEIQGVSDESFSGADGIMILSSNSENDSMSMTDLTKKTENIELSPLKLTLKPLSSEHFSGGYDKVKSSALKKVIPSVSGLKNSIQQMGQSTSGTSTIPKKLPSKKPEKKHSSTEDSSDTEDYRELIRLKRLKYQPKLKTKSLTTLKDKTDHLPRSVRIKHMIRRKKRVPDSDSSSSEEESARRAAIRYYHSC